jgi:hypothetical protein
VEYSLAPYLHAGAHGDVDAQAPAPQTRYTLAPESGSEGADGGGDQPSGNGRCRKRGATALNRCS